VSAPSLRERIRFALSWPYLAAIVLALLFLFHTVNNWLWVNTNLTLMGWDRSSHLGKTLIYNDILREISPRSLFTALTWPWNRPPLPFLSVVPFYRLFGVSTDVALMSNCLYLAILLGSVYGIGRHLYGRKVGLLASFLVSFYPVLFSISRLSYVDYALTAMVAAGIYLLLKTDGFRNRRWSLLFGLGVGLGLLTKWPFIAFAGAPILYVAWRSHALKRILYVSWTGSEGATFLRRVWTSPWLHGTAALVLTGAWYIPNWERLSGFALGYWLPLISWVLVAATFYILSRGANQATNLLSAGMIGVTLASAWSLPNIGFSGRFVFVAFGGVNIEGKGLSFLDPTFYMRYLSMMVTEQLSPLLLAALGVAIGVLLYRAKRGWRTDLWTDASRGAWILGLWFFVPFVIFTISQTWNSRFNIALLPAAALITARGLLAIKQWRLRFAVIGSFVFLAVVQFFILSYDALYPITRETAVDLPLVGRLNLLGEGAYVMPPSTDRMDSGYWVAPLIMKEIQEGNEGSHSLALLVNYTYLNADILGYLALLDFPQVEVWDLARDEGGAPLYVRLFAADYVIVSTHDPYKLSDWARAAVERIAESPGVFDAVFELKAQYHLPDEEVVFLYGKRLPAADQQVRDYYRHLVDGLEADLTETSAVIVDPPTEVATLARFYAAPVPVYLLPTGNDEEDEQTLQEIMGRYERVFAVFRNEDGSDPAHLVESWLSEHAYRTRDDWYGDVRRVLFAGASGEDRSSPHPLRATLGGQFSLTAFDLVDDRVQPGEILRLSLSWELIADPQDDYVVFVHLLDEEGTIMAQRDSQPLGGLRPTTTWSVGETLRDNLGLLVPEHVPLGEYQLVAGMYLPSTGERLPIVAGGDTSGAGAIALKTVEVVVSEGNSLPEREG